MRLLTRSGVNIYLPQRSFTLLSLINTLITPLPLIIICCHFLVNLTVSFSAVCSALLIVLLPSHFFHFSPLAHVTTKSTCYGDDTSLFVCRFLGLLFVVCWAPLCAITKQPTPASHLPRSHASSHHQTPVAQFQRSDYHRANIKGSSVITRLFPPVRLNKFLKSEGNNSV